MNDRVYCYPGTDVLINALGIHDSVILHEAERDITSRRLMQLQEKPIIGNFDYDHLKGIHYFLFHDIYSWAGGLERNEKWILRKPICFAM